MNNFENNFGLNELTEWNGEKRKMLVWDNTGNEPVVKYIIGRAAGIWFTNEQSGYFHAADYKEN